MLAEPVWLTRVLVFGWDCVDMVFRGYPQEANYLSPSRIMSSEYTTIILYIVLIEQIG